MPTHKLTIGNYPIKPSSRIKILTRQRFHRLLVIGFAGLNTSQKATWHCLCDCGNVSTFIGSALQQMLCFSCGCYRRDAMPLLLRKYATKEETKSPEYTAYSRAKNRCQNPRHQDYPRYGERGVEFRFESYEQFLAHIGRRPSAKHSLDRYPNNKTGHYEIGNVRWATKKEQSRNCRSNVLLTLNDITKSAEEWAEEYQKKGNTLRTRVLEGWCHKCAITLPLRSKCPHRI